MSYYKDALYTLEHITEVPSIFINETVKDLTEVFKELVDKEIELQSRKDKLVVGSEWECVIEHRNIIGDIPSLVLTGEVVTIYIIKGKTMMYRAKESGYITDLTEHFLVCFKPKEIE